ncbi:MAG: tRNA dihydrouridine synthase DusB [Nanoarchaeota archaeon]|nr:tRNA dihydrouridine synthase DusB [Nanoarchaeota archaeon]
MFPKLKSKIILAPLAGINDPAFRLLCRENGAAMVYSEMINADALANASESTKFLLEYSEKERPIGFQLFGNDPKTFAKAAKIVEPRADVIDINMCCPAGKIVKIGAGCALMSNLDLAEEIIRSVVSAVKKPVTVKLRLGVDKQHITCIKLAKIAEKAGASAVALHPRTEEQAFGGKPAMDFIRQLKEILKITVIGNGNVIDGPSAKKMFDKTGCDYIMLGRAPLGNPAIFKEINHYLETGKELKLTDKERLCLFSKYVEYAKDYDRIHFQYIKQQAAYFTKGLHGGRQLRVRLMKANSVQEIQSILKDQCLI